jgi:hypothetical protein
MPPGCPWPRSLGQKRSRRPAGPCCRCCGNPWLGIGAHLGGGVILGDGLSAAVKDRPRSRGEMPCDGGGLSSNSAHLALAPQRPAPSPAPGHDGTAKIPAPRGAAPCAVKRPFMRSLRWLAALATMSVREDGWRQCRAPSRRDAGTTFGSRRSHTSGYATRLAHSHGLARCQARFEGADQAPFSSAAGGADGSAGAGSGGH